jgi:ribosomal protein S27E
VTRFDVVDGQMRLWCPSCGAPHTLSPTGQAVLDDTVGAAPVTAPAPEPVAVPTVPPPPVQIADIELEPFTPTPLPARAPSPPRVLAPVKCPKCAHRQHDPVACEKCGLVFALVRPGETPWEVFSPAATPHVPEARRLWAAVEAQPSRESLHDTFHSFCRANGLTLFAISRYRHRLADDPDDALSQQFLERASRDAMAMVAALPSSNEEFMAQANRFKQVLVAIAAVLCLIAVVTMFRIISTPP